LDSVCVPRRHFDYRFVNFHNNVRLFLFNPLQTIGVLPIRYSL